MATGQMYTIYEWSLSVKIGTDDKLRFTSWRNGRTDDFMCNPTPSSIERIQKLMWDEKIIVQRTNIYTHGIICNYVPPAHGFPGIKVRLLQDVFDVENENVVAAADDILTITSNVGDYIHAETDDKSVIVPLRHFEYVIEYE